MEVNKYSKEWGILIVKAGTNFKAAASRNVITTINWATSEINLKRKKKTVYLRFKCHTDLERWSEKFSVFIILFLLC